MEGTITMTNLLDEMMSSDLVRVRQVKGEDDVYACNFTRDAFMNHDWNELTTKARGLFLDSDGNVVMRGFEKFFNIGENSETTMDKVHGNMEYPARVESKENGFLGLIGAKPVHGEFRFYSKSGNTDWSDLISNEFNREFDEATRERLWGLIRSHDVTLAMEVVDRDSDRHIIEYEESALYYIHAIRNTVEFLIDDDADKDIAPLFSHHPTHEMVYSQDELDRAIERANDSEREGCVVYGANGYMVKVKSDLYLKTKYLRVPLNRVLVNGRGVPNDGSSRSRAVRWVIEHADPSRIVYTARNTGRKEVDMSYVSKLLLGDRDVLDSIELPFAS